MEPYLLSTEDLTKQYGNHKVVRRINMHIKKGAIYGFIGRNGAGKTTFLKMICGLSTPTAGSINAFGQTGRELCNVRSRIGCLIESPGLYGNMTAFENLAMKCRLLGIKDISKESQSLLKIVGLEDTGRKKVRQFSLGMKQRLGIALALVNSPELLILDEPINGLDPQGIAEIREVLLHLNRELGITILISSHILGELSKIATDYGIIDHGLLLEEFPSSALDSRCKQRKTNSETSFDLEDYYLNMTGGETIA